MAANQPSTPKKAPPQTAVFSVRLSIADVDALNRAAQARGVSRNRLIAMLARRASGVLEPDQEMIDAWRDTLRQLSGLATNFNQIARAANRGSVFWGEDDREDLERASRVVAKFRRDLAAIVAAARANREASSTIGRLLSEPKNEEGSDV